jgi:hypothetical protein
MDEKLTAAIAELSADIQAAITAGHVIASLDTVDIGEKASPTGKAVSGGYVRMAAQNVQGMAALQGGKIEPSTAKPATGPDNRSDADKATGVCDLYNYGKDLELRAQARAKLLTSLEGPEKAIAKLVKMMVDTGGYTESEARSSVIAQRKAKGLPV